jgi:hypothetical protein
MLNNRIKKKIQVNQVNISKSWQELWNEVNHIYKKITINYELQSIIN